jgi:iron complex transport system permease protein
LLAADLLARMLLAPQVLPVGIVTALAGAPFFLYLLRRAKDQAFW